MADMANLVRAKRIENLRKELAQVKYAIADHESAAKFGRRRQDEINAELELLGAPEPDARLGLLFTEKTK